MIKRAIKKTVNSNCKECSYTDGKEKTEKSLKEMGWFDWYKYGANDDCGGGERPDKMEVEDYCSRTVEMAVGTAEKGEGKSVRRIQ